MNDLKKNSYNINSQFGEDGIIQKIFEILPNQKEYWCVEFGAWDGKYLSNTHELVVNKNWNGIYIEGNKDKFNLLKKTFVNKNNVLLINRIVDFEGENILDKILKKTEIPYNYDLLSIDIDGNDHSIWESIEIYTPKIIIIEFNPTIPSDIEFVQKKDISLNHGNSLLSLIKLGKLKGYEIICSTFCNAFFVQKEYFELFKIDKNDIKTIWDEETEQPRLFQLYDGTIVLTKDFNLLWNNTKIKKMDLQKIPKMLRYYSDSASIKVFFIEKIKRLWLMLINDRLD